VTQRNELARAGEDIAARFLAAKGWRIVGRNVRCGRAGEIDIVAERGGMLAFVEVKTRRTDRYGTPGEAVTWRKQARIRSLARLYLMRTKPRASAIRFDVVEVRSTGNRPVVTHLENAF
jgi:putative endonuclease